jgi:hypothetical protein
MGGVTCLVCHSIQSVEDTFNAGFTMDVGDLRQGPILDPDTSPAHRTVYNTLQEDSNLCGTCHVVVNPNHVALETTHIEWKQSAFAGSKSCQDCHMPHREGPAATGHRTRTVHDHVMAGVDVSLLPPSDFPGSNELRERARQLLVSAVNFGVTPVPAERRLDVSIENLAGHALPSGATADREMWIEVVLHDAQGNVAFESGTLDERGDLRVANPERTTRPGTDPALVLYTQTMYLEHVLDGGPAVLPDGGEHAPRVADFLWEPRSMKEHLVHVSETDHHSYDLRALGAGHYTGTARLLFRSFPPHLLRKLEDLAGLDPDVEGQVPTVEMASATVDLDLP